MDKDKGGYGENVKCRINVLIVYTTTPNPFSETRWTLS